MKSVEIKKLFIDFFKRNNHIELEEYSLIPLNDKSLLFTNSGMVQFKNIFLGFDEPLYDKVVTVQKCVRLGGKHNDLESIGLSRHHNTSFEMLGNFSFRNTSESHTIRLCWKFLIEELKIDFNKLYITVHNNDKKVLNIWLNEIKIPENHIFFGTDDTNFWSMDVNGPCGYCTEIFYNMSDDICSFNQDNLLEIWNIVFIGFNKKGETLEKLKNIYVDTGMGLERITSVLQGNFDNYKIDPYKSLLDFTLGSIPIELTSKNEINMKIIVDHLKTAIFLLKAGLIPSNDSRGYILKKLIRRAIVKKKELGLNVSLYSLVMGYFKILFTKYNYSDFQFIENILRYEEKKFDLTLKNCISSLENMILSGKKITGKLLFFLYDTYGMPLDFIKGVLSRYNMPFDFTSFKLEMERQVLNSKKKIINEINVCGIPNTVFTGYEELVTSTNVLKIIKDGIFYTNINISEPCIVITEKTSFYSEKGGQIGDIGIIKGKYFNFVVCDTKEVNGVYLHFGKLDSGILTVGDLVFTEVNVNHRLACSSNHSATHLLHAVLKKILGQHVRQAGSFVGSNYLRFDFTHFSNLSKLEILQIEKMVNNYIFLNLEVKKIAKFDITTRKSIRTIMIGSDDVSVELCGGTHVNRTSEIGLFKILKVIGIGSNLKRIEAVTGNRIIELFNEAEETLELFLAKLKTNKSNLITSFEKILIKNKMLEKDVSLLLLDKLKYLIASEKRFYYFENVKVVCINENKKFLDFIPVVLNHFEHILLIFYYYDKFNVCVNISISDDVNNIDIGDLLSYIKTHTEFRGGGNSKNISGVTDKIDCVLESIAVYFRKNLKSEDENVNFN